MFLLFIYWNWIFDTDIVLETTTDLVRERNLLLNLSRCLLDTMQMACFIPGSPGSPPPAGASLDTMNELDTHISPSASLTAALLAMLGSFSSGGGDEANIAILDSEINDLILGMAENFNGGNSRHHGRSAIKNVGGDKKDGTAHRHLTERTAALVLPTLDPSHTVLSHRRYSVCISDLKCVLNVNGMARYFASLPIDRKTRTSLSATFQGKSVESSAIISGVRGTTSDCPLDNWIQVSVFCNPENHCISVIDTERDRNSR